MLNVELDVALQTAPYWNNWMGVWSMEERAFHSLRHSFQHKSLSQHLAAADELILAETEGERAMTVVNGIGILNINGTMMKHASSWGSGCSTVSTRRKILQAKRDASVRGLMIKADTPGGTVAGTKELADTIANFGKPTRGYCCDMTASAGYWTISQCDDVFANAMALVGSIGTYTYIIDASEAFAEAGVKVHLVRAGDFKGVGVPGTKVEDEHLADAQRLINEINGHFTSAVESGRGMKSDQLTELADGRVHLAKEAEKKGLIDGVDTFESAFDSFEQKVNGTSSAVPLSAKSVATSPTASDKVDTGEKPMTEDTTKTTEEKRAEVTAAVLKTEFPDSTAEWRLKALENGWDLAACYKSHAEVQSARAAAAEEKLAAAKTKTPGAPALGKKKNKNKWQPRSQDDEGGGDDEDEEDEEQADGGGDDSGDATSTWQILFSRALKRTGGDRMKALKIVNRENPGLRQAMIEETNQAAGRPCRIPDGTQGD